MIEVIVADRMRMELQARQIGHPRQRRGVARHHFFGGASRWKRQCDDVDPGRSRFGGALLIKELAVDTVRVADEHVGPVACSADCSIRHREVIADDVELGIPRFFEQHFAGVRDRDFAYGDGEDFVVDAAWHDSTIDRGSLSETIAPDGTWTESFWARPRGF